eukprot:TRINITY_DN39982_c0_g1_i1.p1 TRINITY_DN39982_c0_g1~~TRINITY_DN39982_c0_g1_i1.p1  ORF type:complete len:488 (+),score=247.06 TRINITY_DN39982_c0_g1_i1:46-1509(+)
MPLSSARPRQQGQPGRSPAGRPRVLQSRPFEPPSRAADLPRDLQESPRWRSQQGSVSPVRGTAAPEVMRASSQVNDDGRLQRDVRAAREEASRLRRELAAKDDEVGELRRRTLRLTDQIDTNALAVEEKMHELRRQTELEARSYRGRQQSMTAMISQLRQEVAEAQGRCEDISADRDRLLREKDDRAREVIASEQRATAAERELAEAQRELAALRGQREQLKRDQQKLADRLTLAEGLVLDMRTDCAQKAEKCSALGQELTAAQIRAEELQLHLLQAQPRETAIRQALAEATTAVDNISDLRRECDGLRQRDKEQEELINELRVEKHRLMQNLQAGIRERQVIDSMLARGGGDGNPELQLKIVEVEQLRAELAECVQKADDEAQGQRHLVALLKERAEGSDARVRKLADECQRLRAELELTQRDARDVGMARDRYQAATEQLEAALRDMAALRQELHQERQLEQQALRDRVDHSRQHLGHAQSPPLL